MSNFSLFESATEVMLSSSCFWLKCVWNAQVQLHPVDFLWLAWTIGAQKRILDATRLLLIYIFMSFPEYKFGLLCSGFCNDKNCYVALDFSWSLILKWKDQSLKKDYKVKIFRAWYVAQDCTAKPTEVSCFRVWCVRVIDSSVLIPFTSSMPVAYSLQ